MPKQPHLVAQVTALLVAQDAFKDVRGRTHIIGVFDTVSAVAFPVNISFMVYSAIKGQGTHTALIKLENSLGDRVAESEPIIVEVNQQKGHQVFMGFAVTFKSSGLYRVVAFLDGIEEIVHPLFLREEAPSKSEAAGA